MRFGARTGCQGCAARCPQAVLVSLTQDAAIHRFPEKNHNIVRWTEMGRGGHLAALEEPDFLIQDLRQFFGLSARS